MLIKRPDDIKSSEVTDKELYLNRRQFIRTASLGAAGLGSGLLVPGLLGPMSEARGATKLTGVGKSAFSTDEPLTPLKDITSYNNFYEFGTGKSDPQRNSKDFKTRPWTVTVEGEVHKPKTFGIEELLKMPLEERVYRMRCVEAWSMVIPVDRLRAESPDQGGGTHGQGQVHPVRHASRSRADARPAPGRPGLAVPRGLAHG